MRERPRLTRPIAFVLVLAVGVGAGVGLIAVALIGAVDLVARGVERVGELDAGLPGIGWLAPALATATLSGVAFGLVRTFAKEAGGSGVDEVEGALDGTRPARWRRVLPVKFVGASLALGSGLLLGREGPTIQLGGNLGAAVSDWLRRGGDDRHVLIASGAAAGLSAAFNAPLAGAIFVIEEMRPQFRFGFLSFQSVLASSVVADLVVRTVSGQAPQIASASFAPAQLASLWLFLLLGAVLGTVAVVFGRLLVALLDVLEALPDAVRLASACGVGALVGIAGWMDPLAVGGGYTVVRDALAAHGAILPLLLLFGVRFVLTIASFTSGVPGGIFAPMLGLGTLIGTACGLAAVSLLPSLVEHPGSFAVAGMACFFAATVRAPITGIVLVVEMTGDFQQVLPLMISCLAAAFVAEALGARPIYEVLLERKLAKAEGDRSG